MDLILVPLKLFSTSAIVKYTPIKMEALDISEPESSSVVDTRKTITIPADVYAYIISFCDIYGDHQTILNCTLVSHTWLPIGQSLLFDQVILNIERSWTRFKSFLTPSTRSRVSPNLGVVRELFIETKFQESWSHEVLVACSRHLTGLQRLYMKGISWNTDRMWRSSLSSIPPNSYGSLRRLDIDDVLLFDIGDLYHIISTFPTTSRLWLSSIDFLNHSMLEATSSMTLQELEQLPELPSRTYLSLGTCDSQLLWYLKKFGLMSHLKEVVCGYNTIHVEEDWKTLSEMIDSCSLWFLHFELDMRICKAPCTY